MAITSSVKQVDTLERRLDPPASRPRDVPPPLDHPTLDHPAVDRFDTVWRAKWIVVAVALVVTVLTYVVSSLLPPTFQSSGLVQVSAINNGVTSQADTITASNSLASQYAQYATAGPVIEAAVGALGPGPVSASLGNRVAAATVANQNLIRITVQASSATNSRRGADAVAAALNAYIAGQGDAAVRSFADSLQSQLTGLDASITSTRTAVAKAAAAAARAEAGSAGITTLNTQQTLLSELLIRRETLSSQAASTEVSLRPSSGVVGAAGTGAQVQPNPRLYSVVAFLVALFAAAEVAILVRRRKLVGRSVDRAVVG